MRESRVAVFPLTTISADGATNGSEIDLLADYAGDHIYGTGDYGLGVTIMGKGVVTGTGDGFTVTFKWQTYDGTNWLEAGQIGVMTVDTDGNFVKGGAVFALTRAKLQSRLTVRGHTKARLVATAAGITGGETINIEAWLDDATINRLEAGDIS